LSAEQKDNLWEWLDEYPCPAEDMIEIVGRADGLPNVGNMTVSVDTYVPDEKTVDKAVARIEKRGGIREGFIR